MCGACGRVPRGVVARDYVYDFLSDSDSLSNCNMSSSLPDLREAVIPATTFEECREQIRNALDSFPGLVLPPRGQDGQFAAWVLKWKDVAVSSEITTSFTCSRDTGRFRRVFRYW
jgi:hypothetical protein